MSSLSHHQYFYKPKGALRRLMFSRMARRISTTLLHLFSPVFIYTIYQDKGYGLAVSLVVVLFYYLVMVLTNAIVQFLSEDLSRKLGFKNIIRLSALPFLLFIILINFTSSSAVFLFAASICLGIHTGLYWWGYHGYFIKKGDQKHFGASVGEANFLETVASVVTPVFGSLAISFWGFESVFVIAFLFILVSVLLLGSGSKTRQVHDIRTKDMPMLLAGHKLTSLAYIGMGAETFIAVVVWPLFLYLFFGKLISLGLVVSASSLIASLFSVAIGGWVDVGGEKKVVRLGAGILFFAWIIRFFGRNLGIFISGDSLRNFGQRMVTLPLNTLSYKKALEAESAKAVLFLETNQILGAVAAIFLISVLVYVGLDLSYAFLVSSVFSLFPLLWSYRNK